MYKKNGVLLATTSLVMMALVGCHGTTTTSTTSTTPPPTTTPSTPTTPTTYTIGGTATGFLASTQLTLQDNGGDDLVLTQSGTFSFATPLSSSSTYNVTIKTQPTDGTLFGVTYGSGTVGSSTISNVTVSPIAETVLHSFTMSSISPVDGADPQYGHLIQAKDGNFYGMTRLGGVSNAGTVFKMTPAGAEIVLYSFSGGNDGNTPDGSLIQGTDGNFYGMTETGGTGGRGTVFQMTPAGVITVLHSFGGGGADGGQPFGNLVQGADGNFYGMTLGGGPTNSGTVFQMTPAGVVTVLHSFGSFAGDGAYPYGSLIQGTDGNFYGMTSGGGNGNNGTVFKITLAGAETVLYSFTGGADGGTPYGSLVQGTDGNFYGMTSQGSTSPYGSVFKMSPAGGVAVLYLFTGGADGGTPYGNLVQGPDGNFYGMTSTNGAGHGTVFQITTSGVFTRLYPFSGGADGGDPYGSLVQGADGYFYGMTSRGGASSFGTVFKIN